MSSQLAARTPWPKFAKKDNLMYMKRLAFHVTTSVFLTILLNGYSLAQSTPATHPANPGILRSLKPVPNQYIIQFVDSVTRGDVPDLADQLVLEQGGGEVMQVYRYAIKGFAARIPARAALAIAHNPRVALVEEDSVVSANATQLNPPSWGLDRIDQHALPLNNKINYDSNGGGVHVYVIDTGILTSHVDFGGRASVAIDVLGDGHNGIDCNGHGTHVSGIIGGTTYGVAKNVQLFAVRVLDCTGQGTSSTVTSGVDWVTGHAIHPAIANMSLGGPKSTSEDDAVRNSIASGVTYTIAAGNVVPNGQDASNFSPSDVSTAIVVGATDISDARASFSNFGSVLSTFAPGVNITSDWIGSNTATQTESGTSMAAPHVAGLASLYLQGFPTATPATVQGIIVSNSTGGVVSNPGTGSPNLLGFSPPCPPVEPASPLKDMLRYFKVSVLDHFYTSNYSEVGCGGSGFGLEAIAFNISTTQQTGTVPLYRYVNSTLHRHFYTTNFNELGNGANGYVLEGTAGYVYSTQVAGTVPLYRYIRSTGQHFYTTLQSEVSGDPNWTLEGTQCYVLPGNSGY
jgi:subtilisin family serine protease